jgi:hypothetical protein
MHFNDPATQAVLEHTEYVLVKFSCSYSEMFNILLEVAKYWVLRITKEGDVG